MFSSYPLLLCHSRFLHTFAHYPCTLRALGLFWLFGLFGASFFFYANGRYPEKKSWKIDPKAPKQPSRRGRQTGHWQNPGPIAKTDFWAVVCFSPKLKTTIFTYVIPVGTRSIVNVGHFFMAQTVPPSFFDHGPKSRVLILTIVEWPKTGMSPRKWPLPRKKR